MATIEHWFSFAGGLRMWRAAVYVVLVELCTGYVFTSSGELSRVFTVERAIVEVLKEHEAELEHTLSSIREYVSEVEDVYKGECPNGECNETEMFENIVGNPLHNYNLLKRTNVNWRNVEDAIKKTDKKGVLAKMKKIKTRNGKMPMEEDLEGMVRAINRLQEVYELDVSDLAAGRIGGVNTAAELGAKDTLYMGRSAVKNNQPSAAVAWLEEAVVQAAKQPNGSLNVAERQALQQSLNQAVRNLASKAGQPGPSKINKKKKYKIGVIPPKTTDPTQMTNSIDQENYLALCRGESLLPAHYTKLLTCYYSVRDDPYFTIHPVAVEVLHLDPHPVLQFHDIISEKEVGDIVKIAKPLLNRAAIGKDKTTSDMRVSKNAWIEDKVHPTVDKLSARINWVTGLQTSALYDMHREGRKEEYEFLQVNSYGAGGHYAMHQDPMFVYKDSNYIAQSIEQRKPEERYNTGDRMSTFMMYLSPVRRGGLTAFPRLGIAVRPEHRSAVFWHNLRRSGRSDMAMLHAACPVLLGSKIVANKWIREVANILNRPCYGDINV